MSHQPQPPRRHRPRNVILGIIGAFVVLFVLLAVLGAALGAGHKTTADDNTRTPTAQGSPSPATFTPAPIKTYSKAQMRAQARIVREDAAKARASKAAAARAAKRKAAARHRAWLLANSIQFIVSGSYAQVTYGAAGSDLQGSVPMDVTQRIGSPIYYAIDAQLQGGGTVSCEIKVAGQVISRSTASGSYNIATCEISQDPITGDWQNDN
jgi:hypothetical protein